MWHHRLFPTMSPNLKMSTRTLKILYYSQEATFKKHFGKKNNFPSNRLWKSLQGRHEKRPQSGHMGMPAF